MATKVDVETLRIDQNFSFRSRLDQDQVARYMDLYRSGKEKAIKVQKGRNVVIDGFHRVEACKRLGIKKILAKYIDVEDNDLLIESWISNMKHGVPPSREERDRFIVRSVTEFGKTPQQIADLVGIGSRRIYQIIGSEKISNPDNRKKLTEADRIAIAKLLIEEETQDSVARIFGVSQSTISEAWAEFRDEVYRLYTAENLLKREVAEKAGLLTDEIDRILQEYGDPLNFEPFTSTWWPAFGLDHRFGKENPSNLPAGLVRNILALYTRLGDTILDPAAGGGVVLDVAEDMVNRKCFGYDLMPKHPDIRPFNILNGPPPEPESPDLILIDLPYGPQKSWEYSVDPDDLANMPIPKFLDSLSKTFNYWNSGTLVVLMSSFRGSDGFIDLPYEAEKRLVEAGWRIVEHIVNEHGRIASETGFWIEKARKERWLLRKHIHILVGRK